MLRPKRARENWLNQAGNRGSRGQSRTADRYLAQQLQRWLRGLTWVSQPDLNEAAGLHFLSLASPEGPETGFRSPGSAGGLGAPDAEGLDQRSTRSQAAGAAGTWAPAEET